MTDTTTAPTVDPSSEEYKDYLAKLDFTKMSLMEKISLLPDEERDDVLNSMTESELTDARLWLRPSQIAVIDDPAPEILDMRGRGAGKTFTGASWVIEKARKPGVRIHLVGRTVADVRDVMIQGESGIMSKSPADFRPEYTPSVRRIVWPNGSVAMSFSADSPDQLRGPQSDYTWCDELAAWRMKPDSSGATAWDHVRFSTRLGVSPQVLVTTTPRRVKVVRELLKKARDEPLKVSLHVGSMLENAANLSPEYISNMMALYAGTALEQQEIHGVMLEEVAGALWRETDIRIRGCLDLVKWVDDSGEEQIHQPMLHDYVTVIGVDPGVTTGGDATGIVVGRGTIMDPSGRPLAMTKREFFVVSDETQSGLSPEKWAANVVAAWARESNLTGRPAIVVAEKNQGGELVSTVIKQSPGGDRIPIALVHSKLSKAARAEPVLLAYRQNRVWHEDELPDLQEEMTTWEPDVGKWSPNRIDAMVHAARSVLVNDEILRALGAIRISRPVEHPLQLPSYRNERASASMSPRHRRHGRNRT